MKRRTQSSQESTGSGANGTPFGYADYVQAKKTLRAALRGPHFYALVSGASGMGKTCLLRDIRSEIDRHRHQVIYVSSSQTTMVGILRFLAQSLHVTPRRSYLETLHILSEAVHAQTAHLLLWIDEADRVDAETLHEVRMLAESDLNAEPLTSVVLSGLPTLTARLDAPGLFPLKRRIGVRCLLAGLRRDELDPFLDHRFGSSEAQRIPTSVRDELFERTQATPALIDTVVRHALGRSNGPLDADVVRAVLDTHGL